MIAVKITAICFFGVLGILTIVGIFPFLAGTVSTIIIGVICALLILTK